MQTQTLAGITVPRVGVGCMRLGALALAEAERFVLGAVEQGATFFDHADIYGGGECETIFGAILKNNPGLRKKITIQSKCGIRTDIGIFDFSKAHILASVDKILARLGVEHLDFLLLHRPDALCEPQEVAEAFDTLHHAGKVRHFGVSNQNPMQIELLQKYLDVPLVVNQLQFSITNATMVTQGQHVNMQDEPAVNRDGSVLDYCRLHDITIQPWSPFQFGMFEGVFVGHEKFPALNAALDTIASAHNVSPTTIALAWILRHPAKMQPIVGTTNPARLTECIAAADITLSREDWYTIYKAAGNVLP